MSNKGVVLNWDSVAFLSGPSMWFTILVRALYLLSGHDVRRWKKKCGKSAALQPARSCLGKKCGSARAGSSLAAALYACAA